VVAAVHKFYGRARRVNASLRGGGRDVQMTGMPLAWESGFPRLACGEGWKRHFEWRQGKFDLFWRARGFTGLVCTSSPVD